MSDVIREDKRNKVFTAKKSSFFLGGLTHYHRGVVNLTESAKKMATFDNQLNLNPSALHPSNQEKRKEAILVFRADINWDLRCCKIAMTYKKLCTSSTSHYFQTF